MTHKEKLQAFMADHKSDVPASVLQYARKLYRVDPTKPNPAINQPPLVWFDHFIDAVIRDWERDYVDVPHPSHLRLIKTKAA